MRRAFVGLSLAAGLLVAGVARAGDVEPPLRLTLDGPADPRPGREITVTLAVERQLPTATPMRLVWRLPTGAQLVAGTTSETLVDATSPRIVRTVRLRFARVPAGDLVATVDARGEAFGAHAVARYAFGRPPAKLPTPSRTPHPGLGLTGTRRR